MKKFKVGDKVICSNTYYAVKKDNIGIIRCITQGYPAIGVEWDQPILDGNDLKGLLANKQGYFIGKTYINFMNYDEMFWL